MLKFAQRSTQTEPVPSWHMACASHGRDVSWLRVGKPTTKQIWSERGGGSCGVLPVHTAAAAVICLLEGSSGLVSDPFLIVSVRRPLSLHSEQAPSETQSGQLSQPFVTSNGSVAFSGFLPNVDNCL